MRPYITLPMLVVLLFSVAAVADPTVTLTLESTQDGQSVSPGATIDWTIKVSVSTGDNAGLALICCDLVQDGNNPAFLDVPPADGVPASMTNFSRPDGISNPGETNPTTGYIGVQRGDTGSMNLIQIGGGQNTFGEALADPNDMAQNPYVVGGVGQDPNNPQIVASGSFQASATSGTYVFRLDNGLANVVDTINTPPAFSPVSSATVTDLASATFNFTVSPGPAPCRGDANCDGTLGFTDIAPFVEAVDTGICACDPTGYNCDVNGDGTISFTDIAPFVDLLDSGATCP